MKVTRFLGIACVLALITLPTFCPIPFLGFSCLSFAQGMNGGGELHATGLILMTPQEAKAFRKAHPRVEKVLPNDIALERANKARAKKGLPPLPKGKAVPRGREIISYGEGDVSGAESLSSQSLSVFVDNSTLKCFPVIRSQGSLGSCTTFATTYYQLTHMVGLIVHPEWDQKLYPEDNTIKFSPRWTYNFQRDSENEGSSFWDNYDVLQHNGACTWAEFPYDGIDYREWCMDPGAWEHAIYYRIDPISYITDDQLELIKQTLSSGYILTFGTYIRSWQYTTIKDNPDATEDDPFVGQDIAYWVRGTLGGHAMTIVGYNDAIWTDVNNNNKIDAGELGAFRIANSWGTDWKDGGFTWLAYDALKEKSNIKRAPRGRRVAALPEGHVYVMTVKEYTPKLLAKFTINHAKRNQLVIHLGISEGAGAAPSITWYPGVFNLHGGEYAFDGTTTACDGTFVLDFTDILTPGIATKRYYLGVFDSKTGDPATLLSFALKDVSTGIEVVSTQPSLTVDADEIYTWIDYQFDIDVPNHPPQAVISATPTSGSAPLTVYFDGSGSYDPDGTIAKHIWNFGDNSIYSGTDGITAEHTYEVEGLFCAKLTVTDEAGVSSAAAVFIRVGSEPEPGGEMHVSAIDMSLKEAGPNVNAIAVVTIVDASGAPVSGATVYGHWSGATSDSDSGITDDNGQVTFKSDRVKNPSPGTAFTFTVDNVAKEGWTYDESANVETSDSIVYGQTSAPAVASKIYPTQLGQAYPSPGNPEVWIPFTLSRTEHVIIRIYDINGRPVRVLDLGQKASGAYVSRGKAAYWNGRNEKGERVSSGIYFYVMEAGPFTAVKKMLISK